MPSLGALGRQHDPLPEGAVSDTFDWFGATIRITPEVNEVELIDFMSAARNIETDGMAGLAALRDAFQMIVHKDDFGTFWRLAKEQRQNMEDLSQVFQVLIEAAANRPTQEPSGSSPGQPAMPANSPAVSSSPVSPGPRLVPTPPQADLEPTPRVSRPDLQALREDAAADRARIARAAAAG